ncbi:hypothetical protein EH206_06990 [Brenneria nigrifluens DSM 30175 = ATCC 13028]|uniref:Uncharacterized protein n=1 Tax=Brenneria nigrifluens DSM 30175 = ATCC 13028 TaxID=1121120 RepID=A0A2U1UPT0_9GAMM|nr:hypothetical protein DDT54_13445 [Brenneria nigrifluens DSM 30175 = ATCC 13028]QCR03945.1 hypothetical protein EH206_06990 [Brenneria nigrifluens DSM 30175 = ATCC 13028]
MLSQATLGLPGHYTIFKRNACSPIVLLGLFFDLAHIFPNLVSKKTGRVNSGFGMIFYTFSLKKRNHDFINTRRSGDNNFSPVWERRKGPNTDSLTWVQRDNISRHRSGRIL